VEEVMIGLQNSIEVILGVTLLIAVVAGCTAPVPAGYGAAYQPNVYYSGFGEGSEVGEGNEMGEHGGY